LLLLGLCLSGAAALIYEVVWMRALSLVMGSTTYALSTMLAAFMTGLTLGGYLGGLWADRTRDPAQSFGLLEAGIAVFGLATFVVIKNLTPVYAWVFYTFHLSFSSFSIVQFLLSFVVMLIPTTLMGATFPLVLKARAKRMEELGRETGDVYSINNLGAILGSFAAGFILIPAVGVTTTNIIAAGLNLVVALTILSLCSPSSRIWGAGGGVLFLFTLLLSIYSPHPSYLYNYYRAARFPSYDAFKYDKRWQRLIFEKEGVQGLVQVFKDTKTKSLYLINSGKIEGSAVRSGIQIEGSSIDWGNQLLLAYLPLEARPGMRSFLTIGLGTGTTLRAAMSDVGLREIDCVEINPVIPEAVKRYFYPELFNDPRINFIVADARNYLTLVPRRYDIISSEPSYPVDQGISNLFSLEFFRLVKNRLTERGVFAQWLPGYLFSRKERELMIRTFGLVFPHTYAWQVMPTNDIILLGSDSPLILPGDIFERIEKREKAEGLLRNYRLWLSPDDVKRMVDRGGIVNTDDRPFIEFAAARNMLRGGTE
jgi:spermidine synthase